MKKILLILMIIFFTGNAFGASSDDVYLRKDVFEAKMDAFMAEIRLMNMDLRREMQEMKTELDQEIQDVKTELHQEMDKRFNEVDKRFNEMHSEIQVLSSKVDSLDDRTESTKTTVYWGLAFMGLILASAVVVPPLADFFKGLRKKEPSFTLEDVKHLIKLEFEELSKTV